VKPGETFKKSFARGSKLNKTEPLAKLLKGEHDYTDLRINRINI